ncbi:MAG: hypothetical protein LBE83_01395 [Propionibacteriaceae bacterium]|jgi:type VII secretion integral membrane protein EccD|nr:hypothetical protein [Propionibacteriaceae bacterium]
MSGFTPLTLVSDQRRAEVVVASDNSLATLLPNFLGLLGLAQESGPYVLVRPIGSQLDLTGTCLTNEVHDGEVLHVVPGFACPLAPVVRDLPDQVAKIGEKLPQRWSEGSRQVVGALSVAVGAAMLGSWNAFADMPSPWDWLGLSLGLIVLAVTAIIAGRLGWRAGGIVLTAAAAGLSFPLARVITPLLGVPPGIYLVGLVWIVIFGTALGFGLGVGLRHSAAGLASAIGALTALTGVVMWVLGVDPILVSGVLVVIIVGLTRLIPAWALVISGLTGLNDANATGTAGPRPRVEAATKQADQILAWSMVAVAGLVVMPTIALTYDYNPWALGLTAIILVTLITRARDLPAAWQVGALWGAAFIIACALPYWLPTLPRLVGYAGLILVAMVCTVARLPETLRAQGRRWADLVEKVALIAAVPVLLGLFGVYTALLGAFA